MCILLIYYLFINNENLYLSDVEQYFCTFLNFNMQVKRQYQTMELQLLIC